MTAEPTAVRASARAPKGMPTSWATPSETDAAATPVSMRSFDGATAIRGILLALLSSDRKHLAALANRLRRRAVVACSRGAKRALDVRGLIRFGGPSSYMKEVRAPLAVRKFRMPGFPRPSDALLRSGHEGADR